MPINRKSPLSQSRLTEIHCNCKLLLQVCCPDRPLGDVFFPHEIAEFENEDNDNYYEYGEDPNFGPASEGEEGAPPPEYVRVWGNWANSETFLFLPAVVTATTVAVCLCCPVTVVVFASASAVTSVVVVVVAVAVVVCWTIIPHIP